MLRADDRSRTAPHGDPVVRARGYRLVNAGVPAWFGERWWNTEPESVGGSLSQADVDHVFVRPALGPSPFGRTECPDPGCPGLETYNGRPEGCGHPTKTSGCAMATMAVDAAVPPGPIRFVPARELADEDSGGGACG